MKILLKLFSLRFIGSIFGLASPHNVFIEVLIYTGIVGLFLYLVFILRMWLDLLSGAQ
jgi:O-antigen ligase